MSLGQDDLNQINQMIQAGIASAVPVIVSKCSSGGGARTPAEIGSPEFAEDRTQINSLNNKEIFAREATRFDSMFFHTFKHTADLDARLVKSFDSLLGLQDKLNSRYFDKQAQSDRWQDDNAYVTRYDLSNPNTLGTSDAIRTQPVVDTTTLQTGILAALTKALDQNTTFQDAVQAAVALGVTQAAESPTFQAAIGAAVAAALVNTPASAKPAA